jgi:Ca-activated chloride channel homolog
MKKIILMTALLVCAFSSVFAQGVSLELSLAHPLLAETGLQTTYLRVGLSGYEPADQGSRPLVNAALLIDRSGSMSGERMRQAIQAGHTALEMLRNGDAVSIITYSDSAEVIIPATLLDSRNRARFHRALDAIEASGSTALFAGVAMGGRELETYLQGQRVNRVILLSDGIANIGPSSPRELGNLGETLRRRGISVSTIGLGLGYNADLMYELAARSDGNHAFVENPSDLAGIFRREFESLMAVVARDAEIRISFAPGLRPLRLLNREGELYGNQVVFRLNQLYALQEQYLLIEVEVDPERVRSAAAGASAGAGAAVEVSAGYLNLGAGVRENISDTLGLRFSNNQDEILARQDRRTLADVTLQIATNRNESALRMREEGRVDEARILLQENAAMLTEAADMYDEPQLKVYAEDNIQSADRIIEDSVWEQEQKKMRASQFGNRTQQSY